MKAPEANIDATYCMVNVLVVHGKQAKDDTFYWTWIFYNENDAHIEGISLCILVGTNAINVRIDKHLIHRQICCKFPRDLPTHLQERSMELQEQGVSSIYTLNADLKSIVYLMKQIIDYHYCKWSQAQQWLYKYSYF